MKNLSQKFDQKFEQAFDGFDAPSAAQGSGFRGKVDRLRGLSSMDDRFRQKFDAFDRKFEEFDQRFEGLSAGAGNAINEFVDRNVSFERPSVSVDRGRFDMVADTKTSVEFCDCYGESVCEPFVGTTCHQILPSGCDCCIVECNACPPYVVQVQPGSGVDISDIAAPSTEAPTGNNEKIDEALGELRGLRSELDSLKNKPETPATPQAPSNQPLMAALTTMFASLTAMIKDGSLAKLLGRLTGKKPEETDKPATPDKPDTPSDDVGKKLDELTKAQEKGQEQLKDLAKKIKEFEENGGSSDDIAELKREQRKIQEDILKLFRALNAERKERGLDPLDEPAYDDPAPAPETDIEKKAEDVASKVKEGLGAWARVRAVDRSGSSVGIKLLPYGVNLIERIEETDDVDTESERIVEKVFTGIAERLSTYVRNVKAKKPNAENVEFVFSLFGTERTFSLDADPSIEEDDVRDGMEQERKRAIEAEVNKTGGLQLEGDPSDTEFTVRLNGAPAADIQKVRYTDSTEADDLSKKLQEARKAAVKKLFEGTIAVEKFTITDTAIVIKKADGDLAKDRSFKYAELGDRLYVELKKFKELLEGEGDLPPPLPDRIDT